MNKLKTLLANSVFYFGYGILKIGNFFMVRGLKLHLKLKTELGLEMVGWTKDIEKSLKDHQTTNKTTEAKVNEKSRIIHVKTNR